MKKLIIPFALFNLLPGIALLIAEFVKKLHLYGDYVICLACFLFIIAGVGLLARTKIGWTLTIIMNSFTISFIGFNLIIFALITQLDFSQMRPSVTRILLLLSPFAVMGFAIFSLVHTQKIDFMQDFQIEMRLKKIATLLALSVPVVMAGWIYLIFRFGKEFSF